MVADKPKMSPWDRRPWPEAGDDKIDTVYCAVGKLLSSWEGYEAILSACFSLFIAKERNAPARRAYHAVRTFQGRTEMLKAASESYFHDNQHALPLQDFFKSKVIKICPRYADRRNDVAHGVVEGFRTISGKVFQPTWALYPSFASYKDRSTTWQPEYCYTSRELDYFTGEILALKESAIEVATWLRERGHPDVPLPAT